MLKGFADPLSTRLAHSHFASTTIGVGTRIVWVACCPEETNALSCDQPCVDVLADIRSLLRPMHIAMGGIHDSAQIAVGYGQLRDFTISGLGRHAIRRRAVARRSPRSAMTAG